MFYFKVGKQNFNFFKDLHIKESNMPDYLVSKKYLENFL